MNQELFSDTNDIYLLAHSIGKMPVSTQNYCQQHFFAHWQSNKDDIWPQWLQQTDIFKHALAELFNGSADAFCPQSNVSSALTKLIGSLPQRNGRNTLLMCEHDFPSAGFVLQQAKKLGYQIKVIAKQSDPQNIDTWAAAMSDDVQGVLITHVHYNTNKLIPVDQITTIAHHKGIYSMVDVAQSAGIVPIDLSAWQADAVVGSCIKWLCGGPGAGFLWVTPTLIEELEPSDVGWFSHQNPFEFDINHFEYSEDSNRFWGGTPSVLPYVCASNSITLLHQIGIENIRAHNIALNKRLIENLPLSYFAAPIDSALRGGTLVINHPKLEHVKQNLHAAGVLFDSREYGIRLSPHIYSNENQMQTTLEQLRPA